MIVSEWMSTRFTVLPVETLLPEALRILNTRGVQNAGVLRNGHIAGAVTRSDIYEMLESGDPMTLASRKTLGAVVPPSAVTVQVDDPVDRAARFIVERGLPAVPVYSKDQMVGVLTPVDVCRAFCHMMGSMASGAPLVLTLTMTRGADFLEQLGRRCDGLPIHGLVAYPASESELHVMMRLGPGAASAEAATRDLERCA